MKTMPPKTPRRLCDVAILFLGLNTMLPMVLRAEGSLEATMLRTVIAVTWSCEIAYRNRKRPRRSLQVMHVVLLNTHLYQSPKKCGPSFPNRTLHVARLNNLSNQKQSSFAQSISCYMIFMVITIFLATDIAWLTSPSKVLSGRIPNLDSALTSTVLIPNLSVKPVL